jgi:Mitochondrial carrier protein
LYGNFFVVWDVSSGEIVEINDGKPINFFQKTLSGMLSGSLAVCIGSPFDIALVRLQSDGMAPPQDRRNYKNVFDAFLRTAKDEGVGALYKGLAPNILRGMSMNVGQLACYDQAKEIVAAITGDPMLKGPNFQTTLGASAIAGFTAAFFSLPLDLIKIRLMAQKPDILTGEMPIVSRIRRTRLFFFSYFGRTFPVVVGSVLVLATAIMVGEIPWFLPFHPPFRAAKMFFVLVVVVGVVGFGGVVGDYDDDPPLVLTAAFFVVPARIVVLDAVTTPNADSVVGRNKRS